MPDPTKIIVAAVGAVVRVAKRADRRLRREHERLLALNDIRRGVVSGDEELTCRGWARLDRLRSRVEG